MRGIEFQLKDGDAEQNPLSSNHLWRRTISSIFGFIKRVVFKIVPTIFPSKSITRPPLIAETRGVAKPQRLASSVP